MTGKEGVMKSKNYYDTERNYPSTLKTDTVSDPSNLSYVGLDDFLLGEKQSLPDARKHQIISFIKSGVRIIGYAIIPFSLVTATIVLILSEVIGIIEELV